ncbi:MAG TPA: hypothetical protein VNA24_09710 [Hyalangium sp.]|nr:hypothetical protein [Hyalangium sp.]
MQAQKDLDILVKNDKTQQVLGHETLLVKKNRSRTVEGNQTLLVKKNDSSVIEQNQSLEVVQNRTTLVKENHSETVNIDVLRCPDELAAADEQTKLAPRVDVAPVHEVQGQAMPCGDGC